MESDVVVPVETASDKREWGARTIRRKLTSRWSNYLEAPRTTKPCKDSRFLSVAGDVDVRRPLKALEQLCVDRGVAQVRRFEGGERAATKALNKFVRTRLAGYNDARNEPGLWQVSFMSPY